MIRLEDLNVIESVVNTDRILGAAGPKITGTVSGLVIAGSSAQVGASVKPGQASGNASYGAGGAAAGGAVGSRPIVFTFIGAGYSI